MPSPSEDMGLGSPSPARPTGSASEQSTPSPTPPPVPQAHTPAQGPRAEVWGVDVSKWQHPEAALDWPALAGGFPGFGFAFVKASEGAGTHGQANEWYAEDTVAANEVGAYVGAYHYAGPGLPVSKDARAEARHAVASAGAPRPGDLPLVLDLESNPDRLSPDELARWALTWLDAVERVTGRRPIVYTYPTFFSGEVAPDPRFARYPLWIAHYGLDLTEPWVPEPWTAWTFWQYSSEGTLAGTWGFTDLNAYAGSPAELSLLAGITYQGPGVDATGVSLLGDAMLTALQGP